MTRVVLNGKLPEVPVAIGEFWDEFKVTKVLSSDEKCSQSISVIALATHKDTDTPVVVKSFIQYDELTEDQIQKLLYEVEVYRAMRELAVQIPHFATYVQFYVYNDKQLSRSPKFLKKLHGLKCFNKQLKSMKIHPTASPHVHKMLVTTMATGVSLNEYLMDVVRPYQHVLSILFQLLFCVYSMSVMGFQHNDLHYENVHIDENPTVSQAFYTVNKVTYDIQLPVLIRIFDFDLSSCLSCGRNKDLDLSYCSKFGVCNEHNPRFDMYTILSYLEDSESVKAYPQLQQIIQRILGPDRAPEHFDYRMCNETDEGTCMAFPPDQPSTIMTPAAAIATFFKNCAVVGFRRRKSGRR